MRLIGQIQITMSAAEAVHREPGFWDKLKRGLGGKIDLDTGQVRVALEATALVDSVKRAFARIGIDNAVSLVVDDTVIFQDSEGRAGRSARPDPRAVRARFGVRARLQGDEAGRRARGGEPAPAGRGPRRHPAQARRAVGLRVGGRPHPRARAEDRRVGGRLPRARGAAGEGRRPARDRAHAVSVVRQPPGGGAARGASRGDGRREARRRGRGAPDDAADGADARSAQPGLRSVRRLLPEPDEHGAGRHADHVVHAA